ncbi:nicotinate phosphoribosyltransferase [Flavilitoribacter nigricans]|uniref:Nicotinate phosphoribosyltransferase n=1 Tax=Flavilitoribacter nigricans (strain ATCC 23147 / DSM 23189 / NBRC 102662 / NCIMB 1420 / SS-2) TaxID=1122177 RepID=A0A2D0NDV5_FLAN2|nr:nicotinate phosphoribosyltransferase [Flavilitoribacter nigricans]PHN05953.1 nicotinate phosphoribosyltransferase [Flavilitoribacter nigricans DSM 23189 = NBRC 102662]
MTTSHLSRLYRTSWGLFTDLYQLTMGYGYWKNGMAERNAVFHLFYRKNPFGHPYALAAGLDLVIDLIRNFRFSVDDIQYLGALRAADGKPLFNESFLNYLQRMEFNCTISAVPEGTVVFPHQPLLRVEGPLIQAQLLETALLNIINFSTLITTKSARIYQAAQGESVLEFGLRRAQGIDGGLTATRAAYIGGCTGTSNVLAGRLFGIPVKGTHAHSWVMCFDEEIEAFAAYAEAMPNNCIFLVDTYDTEEGVKNAIRIGRGLREKGHDLLGIRLDSGDLAELSKIARTLLDEAGFTQTAIVASNDLDEYRIKSLKEQGAKISVWGVGTRLATAYDQAALGGVYKLAAIADEAGLWEYRVKLSEQAIKISNPGLLQVRRYSDPDGHPMGDQIYNLEFGNPPAEVINFGDDQKVSFEQAAGEEDLLLPVFQDGKLVYQSPDLHAIREHCLAQQARFAGLLDSPEYTNGLEPQLSVLKKGLVEEAMI